MSSLFDRCFRRLLLTQYFTHGWGSPHAIKRLLKLRRCLANRDQALNLVKEYPTSLQFTRHVKYSDYEIYDGHFTSPAVKYLSADTLPPECSLCHFQMVLPNSSLVEKNKKGFVTKSGQSVKPICLHYAGTGDHYFWRRRRLSALPLFSEREVASIIIESPFYGMRKPKQQMRSSLRHVCDLYTMGACLMLESLVLFHWCEENGFDPIITHGVSMGGHMSSLSATLWPKPLVNVPCLSLNSASNTFTEGILTECIPWRTLQNQLDQITTFRDEIALMIRSERNKFCAILEIEINRTSELIVNQTNNTLVSISSDFNESKYSALLDKYFTALNFSKYLMMRKEGGRTGIDYETLTFMQDMMDEYTHLKNYSIPIDPSLTIAVLASHDEYQPLPVGSPYKYIEDIWPGSETRFIQNEGHITSYLWRQNVFREAIYDGIQRYLDKYKH